MHRASWRRHREARIDRALFNPPQLVALGCALLAQVQLSHPAPLDFGELDYSFAILAQIANHLYDDLIYLGTTQPTALEQQHLTGARREGAAVSYDDHPDLQVIDDLAQQFVQHLRVAPVEIARWLVGQ